MTFEELLAKIATEAGATDTVLALLKELKDQIGALEAAAAAVEPVPETFESWGAALADMTAQRDAQQKRYIERFMTGPAKEPEKEPEKEAEPEEDKPKKFTELFKNESEE